MKLNNINKIFLVGDLHLGIRNNSVEWADIQKDFDHAYEGIMQLPGKARFGVYVAYKYYLSLFRKIKKLQPAVIMQERVRIPDYHKVMILVRAGVRSQLNIM